MARRSVRVWSLWDMLTLFVPWVSTSCYNLGLLSERLVYQTKQAVSAGHKVARVPNEMMESVYHSIVIVQHLAEAYQLITCQAATERLLEDLKKSLKVLDADNCAMGLNDAERIGYLLNGLSTTFTDELSKTVFVASRRGDDGLLNDDVQPFGAEVDTAFPSSSYDIVEAARCRALYRWTACVMHLMRALEPALLALQTAVQVNVPKEQWDQIINQIEAKIREITKRSHGKADEQWFSEAASHFRLIKNAWRNHSQHLHDRYDEERALTIYESVRHFMRHLASRLSENP